MIEGLRNLNLKSGRSRISGLLISVFFFVILLSFPSFAEEIKEPDAAGDEMTGISVLRGASQEGIRNTSEDGTGDASEEGFSGVSEEGFSGASEEEFEKTAGDETLKDMISGSDGTDITDGKETAEEVSAGKETAGVEKAGSEKSENDTAADTEEKTIADPGKQMGDDAGKTSSSMINKPAAVVNSRAVAAIGEEIREENEPHFVIEDGRKYYYDENGELVKDSWLCYNGRWFYASSSGAVIKNSFVEKNGRYSWLDIKGAAKTGVFPVKGTYYYGDKDGIIKKKSRWIEYNGKLYRSTANGSLRKNTYLWINGTIYWIGKNGAAAGGVHEVKGKLRFFDENGVCRIKKGWIIYNGKRYYSNADGVLKQNEGIWDKTNLYWLGAKGVPESGIHQVKGKLLYFNEKGIFTKKSGWIEYKNRTYFADAGIARRNSAVWTKSGLYYVGDQGTLTAGVYEINGKLRYFTSDGKCRTKEGWVLWKKNWYYIGANGIVTTSRMISSGGKYYYLHADGEMDTSGNPWAAKVLAEEVKDLESAFDYASSLDYYGQKLFNNTWTSKELSAYGIRNGRGNCYVMAGVFHQLAQGLGYEVHQIAGHVPLRNGGKNPHSWVELVENGTVYVYDPDFRNEAGYGGYRLRYGQGGTWQYVDYGRMN